MRTLDRPLPPIVLDTVETIAHWPVRPVIAIYGTTPQLHWDDGLTVWDDPGDYWDTNVLYRDATCSWTGLEVDTGLSDEAYLFPATRCVFQLDNADGSWSAIDVDGSPSNYGPGTPISIWAHSTGLAFFGDGAFGDGTFGGGGGSEDWWIFDGEVARWDQRADDTIEVEAFDAFSDLAQTIGTFTPGTNGQKLSARLTAILAAAGESARPHRFDTGTVTLTAQETDQAPLEEMQTVAGSDGALLFVDVDGTILGLDRTWRAGRTDQTVIRTLSDNVCLADVVVWDAVISTTDENLADVVVLENIAKLKAQAGTTPGYAFSQQEQQWTTQPEGDALAALLLTDRQPRRMRVSEFDLYLLDPHQPDIWSMVDTRRLDQLRFVHDQKTTGGGSSRVDVNVLVDGLVHTITPDGWVMSIATTKVITYTAPVAYDTGHLYDTGEVYGY